MCIDHAVRISEPLYVIGAMTLIFLDAYVFFTIVLQEVRSAQLFYGLHLQIPYTSINLPAVFTGTM